MATVNLFSRPLFKEGAFSANDPAVRRMAVAKTFDAIDLGAELGATTFVLWGGHEGVESDAAKDVSVLSTATPRPSISAAPTSANGTMTCASPSNQSPMNPAATSCFPPSDMPWLSSTNWSGQRWSA